jgi:hypothetical protein
MAILQYGSVVWARVVDRNGHEKSRPVVVLTPSGEIKPGAVLAGVAVSSAPTLPRPPEHVPLPWQNGGHPRTGLNRPCWAICPWIVAFPFEAVEDIAGIVPTKILNEIIAKLPPPEPPEGAGA